jgi:histidinol phosphatase-like PHP family hydrolase
MIEFWRIIAKDYPDIKVLISSDAHSPEVLDDEAVMECLKMAKKLSLNVIKYVELKNVMKG